VPLLSCRQCPTSCRDYRDVKSTSSSTHPRWGLMSKLSKLVQGYGLVDRIPLLRRRSTQYTASHCLYSCRCPSSEGHQGTVEWL
jgi:hypothetical protein